MIFCFLKDWWNTLFYGETKASLDGFMIAGFNKNTLFFGVNILANRLLNVLLVQK